MSKNNKKVLKTIKDLKVRFIRLWFTDVLGFLKCVTVTPPEIKRALEDGMGFDGSSIEGFARIQESDMVALPDPSTFQILPWSPKNERVARMFCDILDPKSGRPFPGDPRYILKRAVARGNRKVMSTTWGRSSSFSTFAITRALKFLMQLVILT